MSLILCIETGTDVCSVGIAKDGELLSLRESDEGRDHARKVGVFVDELLRETGIAPDELDAVAVGKGPGSYTGLRIGVSFAKGLCYGVRKPLVVATCVGCMIAGFGGLYYVMDYACGVWSNDAFGDRGWLAIALVIFTIWRPNISILASFLFGGLYILYLYIPTGMDHMEFQELYKMIPYVVTLVVLVVTSIRSKRESQPPASLGLAYFREER